MAIVAKTGLSQYSPIWSAHSTCTKKAGYYRQLKEFAFAKQLVTIHWIEQVSSSLSWKWKIKLGLRVYAPERGITRSSSSWWRCWLEWKRSVNWTGTARSAVDYLTSHRLFSPQYQPSAYDPQGFVHLKRYARHAHVEASFGMNKFNFQLV